MLHARSDYSMIQDPTGRIPNDEPVFLLRGQDSLAPGIVRVWAQWARLIGASPEVIAAAEEQAERMEVWQAHGNRKDIPDL